MNIKFLITSSILAFTAATCTNAIAAANNKISSDNPVKLIAADSHNADFNWSGFYIGANIGYASQTHTILAPNVKHSDAEVAFNNVIKGEEGKGYDHYASHLKGLEQKRDYIKQLIDDKKNNKSIDVLALENDWRDAQDNLVKQRVDFWNHFTSKPASEQGKRSAVDTLHDASEDAIVNKTQYESISYEIINKGKANNNELAVVSKYAALEATYNKLRAELKNQEALRKGSADPVAYSKSADYQNAKTAWEEFKEKGEYDDFIDGYLDTGLVFHEAADRVIKERLSSTELANGDPKSKEQIEHDKKVLEEYWIAKNKVVNEALLAERAAREKYELSQKTDKALESDLATINERITDVSKKITAYKIEDKTVEAAKKIADIRAKDNNQRLKAGRIEQTALVVGGFAGYNYALGHIILSAEAGFNYYKEFGKAPFETGDGTKYNASRSFVADARGRVGFAIDRALVYAAAGVSYVDSLKAGGKEFDSKRFGFNVGAGVDYAVSNNFIVRVEYKLNQLHAQAGMQGVDGITKDNLLGFKSSEFKVGGAYKF